MLNVYRIEPLSIGGSLNRYLDAPLIGRSAFFLHLIDRIAKRDQRGAAAH